MKLPADNKKKLASLAMPASRKGALDMDLDMPADDDSKDQQEDPSDDMDPSDGGADDDASDSMPSKSPDMASGAMDKISDDALLAEVKKRGLEKQLDDEGDSSEGDSYDSNDDDSQGGMSLRA